MDNIKKTVAASVSALAIVAGFIENKLEPLCVREADAVNQMDRAYENNRLAEKGVADNWSQPVNQPKVLDWFSAKKQTAKPE